MSFLGVDVGTTGVKAVAFSADGAQIASAYEEYPLLFPFRGAAELDSARVIAAARRVIASVAAQSASDPVQSIGVASQGEAFTPLAADGSVLGNGMVSSDTRAADLVPAFSEAFGAERLYGTTGHTPYPMYSLYKLLWLRDNQPEVWRGMSRILFMQDLVAYTLTGEMATDPSLAARSMLYDVSAGDWSPEVLHALVLDAACLPRIVPSGTPCGGVTAEAASELGLAAGIPVACCGHDQPVGAVGCGASNPGVAAFSIGTVECICPALDRLILDPLLMRSNLASYPHVIGGLWTTVLFSITAGSVLRWLRDQVAVSETEQAAADGVDAYSRIMDAASPEPSRLVVLPHFGPTGTPHFDPDGAGAVFGLKLSTTRAELFRGFLEGISYEMKWNLDTLAGAGLNVTELRAVGGGARSPIWMQIKSDILGVPLSTMRVSESTCLGAARLAGVGAGLLEPEAAEAWAVVGRTFEPDPNRTALYEERFAIYRDLYQSMGGARKALRTMKGD